MGNRPMTVLPLPRRFFVETWGCQMNELDSQRLAGQLMQEGILPTRNSREADLILLNSCSVREKAAQKAFSRLGEYRLLKKKRPHLLIGFCGCVAQQVGEQALRQMPELDFVIGPGRVGELRQILERRRSGKRVVATGFPAAGERRYDIDAVARDATYKGMVTIIEGCNKRCTFCIVPTTRGPEQCRPQADILAEVEHLIEYGFLEVELLGQTVNHWRDPQTGADFAELLDRLASLDGLERLRFVTSYPRDFTQEMIDQFARHANICPYLHLPVQSGSDRILRRMGRGYTVGLYRDLIRRLREARPGIALSTDVIVGFSGETEEDFVQTLQLVAEIRFASIFAFKYSPRPGTAALRLKVPTVAADVADRRLQELFTLQNGIQQELNESLVGKRFEVLVTAWGKKPATQMGRTPCHRIAHFSHGSDGPLEPGSLTQVRIDQALPHSLLGSLV
ncbi:MAG: tRNA (N6-isopentenyl adenosine(37)-C2)-methylthiotransferase MiaB [bacterium]|nr:tRNA (N6-isopentenyl adenosine(37)-C2)-methylthiotransferase MiaB [bacterium]